MVFPVRVAVVHGGGTARPQELRGDLRRPPVHAVHFGQVVHQALDPFARLLFRLRLLLGHEVSPRPVDVPADTQRYTTPGTLSNLLTGFTAAYLCRLLAC